MTPEQVEHCKQNRDEFSKRYFWKYESGQKEHGGNMWDMGAYQALENMEDEVLDMWSYCRQVRKCFDEIKYEIELARKHKDFGYRIINVDKILNRRKED